MMLLVLITKIKALINAILRVVNVIKILKIKTRVINQQIKLKPKTIHNELLSDAPKNDGKPIKNGYKKGRNGCGLPPSV